MISADEDAIRRGRPEVGPTIQIRLPEQTLAEVDALAGQRDVNRSEMIRSLVNLGLDQRHRLPSPQPDHLAPFAVELRERMMAAGIRTTSDLAALAGLNQSMVRRWLLGKSTPDDNGRARLDAVLDRDDDAA